MADTVRLGVNIDHVATVRQARRTIEPDPVRAAVLAELGGADQITIHLREDRRHIQDRDLELLKKTLTTRLNLEMGLADEVRSLLAEEKPLGEQARCAIGYAEMIEHLQGRLSLNDAVERIKKNTRRLAKGQRTWFKTFREVNWIEVDAEEPFESVLARAEKLLG